jgi:hypothetical protein
MDDRLTKALEYSNYKVTVFRQKENLKLRLENLLTYAHNGGMFKISQELISFVDALLRKEINEVVLIDTRENPVKIDNLQEFHDTIIGLYFEATNEFHAEYEKLRKARSVKQATD